MGRLRESIETDEGSPTGEITLIAFPAETFRALSTAAAERNMTIYEMVARAISFYLEKTADEPRLLTEGE